MRARTPVLVWTAAAAYAAGFAALSILRYDAFVTGRFDMGNMVQAVWATAHGHPLSVTDLRGDQISRLGAHADPILVLFAPLWWIWPSAGLLLAAQALAIAAGAVPVHRLARKHLGSERAGLGFALAYLLLPATQWLTLNEFHPVALACPLLLWAFWYLDEDRLALFAVLATAAALTKEEVALVVAGFGVWYAVGHGRRRAGVAIALAAVAWSALAIGVVIPYFNDGAASSFYSRYAEVGGSPGGILHTAATRPWHLFAQAFDARGLHYLWQLLAPLAGLSLLAPLALVAALPEIALNLLSATPTQTSIHFHYTAPIIPVLVVAAVLGAARMPRRRALASVAVGAALAFNYHLGALPFWRAFPGGEDFQARAALVSAHARVAERAVTTIPGGAVVSASNNLGAHLSARRRVLSFPFIQDATWIAADETQPGYADRVAPVATAVQLAWLRTNPEWRLVFEEDGVLVFRRVRPLS